MTPDTSREDAALVNHLLTTYPDDRECWSATTFPLVAACRKAREPKPRYRVLHASYANRQHPWAVIDGPGDNAAAVAWCFNETTASAVAEALNNLERGKVRDADSCPEAR